MNEQDLEQLRLLRLSNPKKWLSVLSSLLISEGVDHNATLADISLALSPLEEIFREYPIELARLALRLSALAVSRKLPSDTELYSMRDPFFDSDDLGLIHLGLNTPSVVHCVGPTAERIFLLLHIRSALN